MHVSLLVRRPRSASLLTLLALSLVIGASVSCRRDNLPDPSSKEYRDVVSAFYTGLASLEVGDDSRAECYLTWTTQLAPEEPAGWADRGLLLLRQREFDKAFEDLERARTLAPDNDQINVLLASVESNRGRLGEAIALLRKAVEANSQNLRARYALAGEIERAGGEGGDREAQTLIEEILQRQPENLAVQLEVVRLAAKRGDAETLRTNIARLAANPAVQTPEVRNQFAALEAAANSSNPRAAAPRVAFLRNVLVRTAQYRKSLRAVRTPPEEGGEPLARFVSLPSPAPNPAAPDVGVTFTAEPLPDMGGKEWAWSGAISLTGEGAPATVVADNREVRLVGGATLSFPGGAEAAAPGAYGILGADLNYDWKTDLVFAGTGGVRLFRQEDAKRWRDVTALTKLPPSLINEAYAGAWAADVDLDGDLDILLGKSQSAPLVLRNNGDDTFGSLAPFSEATRPLRGFVWADMDADGDPDATLLNDDGQLQVFANERGGQFTLLPALSNVNRTSALAVADIDHNGSLDVLALSADGRITRSFLNTEAVAGPAWDTAELTRWTAATGAAPGGIAPTTTTITGAARLFAADVDNNGGLDLIASVTNTANDLGNAGNNLSQAWLSDKEGKLAALRAAPDARIFAVADVTADGRLDLVGLSTSNQPLHVVNRGTKNYHWQVIRPRSQQATGDQRINSFGIGGEMEIRSGLLVQKQVVTSPLVHFGLGEQTRADVVRIVWPNGSPRAEFDLQVDQTILAEQRLKGSCPSLFAWNGTRMNFVKDCAPWSSALGLRINAQDTANILQPEEWNKIRGDQLAPRDGFYDLRITAELWETFYIDHYSLMTVDHPVETEIFVDERFRVPPPKLALHTVAPPRPFASARDDLGQDVSEVVRAEDTRYLDTFGRGQYQGVTRDHYVELELGEDAPRDGPLWLIAHGWMHPTDASINVAISQGRHAPPESLNLEVSDGRGGWRVAQSKLGFPAGKLKTMVIDLSGVFRLPTAPRRLRLRTNLEIFWDKLEWATAPPAAAPPRTERLATSVAELRHRGFSEMTRADESSPEVPNYDKIASTVQRWRDLTGYYTRFGDIRELTEKIDDRIVIVNAGDEMVFRFPAPPPPPAGWTRDFILIGHGWIKDGDFNSMFSQTVLPLPSHTTTKYDTPPGRFEDDPVYRQYQADWDNFHTRYVTPERFHDALRTTR